MEKIIKLIQNHFNCLELSEEDIKIVIKDLNENDKLNSNDLLVRIHDYYVQIILESFLQGDFSYINKFLQSIYLSDSIKDNIASLKKFVKHLKTIKSSFNFESLEIIIKQSPILESLLKSIIDFLIKNRLSLESVTKDNSVISILEVYCVIENINFFTEKESQKVTDDVYCLDNQYRQYLNEITLIPLLTVEQEQQLTRAYFETRDENLKKRIIEANLRLVISVAQSVSTPLPIMDVINEGNIGLIKAIEKFNPSKGYKLSTYAIWWIRKEIRVAIAKGRPIQVTTYINNQLRNYINKKQELINKLGRNPSWLEIEKYTRLFRTKIEELEQLLNPTLSLNEKIDDYGEVELEAFVSDKKTSTFEVTSINNIIRQDILDLLSQALKENKSMLFY